MTNCTATSSIAICGPFVVTKTYALVAKKNMPLIMFLVVIIVATTIQHLWQYNCHNYHSKSDKFCGHSRLHISDGSFAITWVCGVDACSHY